MAGRSQGWFFWFLLLFFLEVFEEQRLEGLALEPGGGCDVLRKEFARSGDWVSARKVTGGFVENSLSQKKPLFLRSIFPQMFPLFPSTSLLTRAPS